MTQQLECSYAGCKSPAAKNLPVCRMHFELVMKKGSKGAPPVPTFKERRPPSPPARKPAPFHATVTHLPPETDHPAPVIVKNVMRKTAPGRHGTGSKVTPSAHTQSSSNIVPPVNSLAQQDGPERKKRRLDDRFEGDQAAKASKDARQHIPGPPNPRPREAAGAARPVHTPSQTLSSQSFYGSRPTSSSASNTNGREAGVEARTFAAARKADQPAASAPPGPAVASTATQPTAQQARSRPMAETAVRPPRAGPPADIPAPAPHVVRDYNAGLKEWFSGAWTKDLIGHSTRATTTPADASTTNGTPQEPMVLSMPFVPKAHDICRNEKQAQVDERGRLPPAGPPAKDGHRVRTATKQDLSALDAFVYGQETAQLPPPRGVVISPKPEPPKPRDEPFFAHLDPRVHWSRPHSEEWYEAKKKEISERPDRKAMFGRAAQRMAERRRAEQGQATKGLSSTSSAAASRSRQSSRSSRDAPPEKGVKSGVNAAALARLRKSFDAWDQALWERDKEATRREALKDRSRKDRDKSRPEGTGLASRR